MTALRKSESSREVIRTIDRIEILSDKSFMDLSLLRGPWPLAAWAILTESIRVVETSVPAELYASRNHINAATNMSMLAALFYRFARRYGMRGPFDASKFIWSSRLAEDLRLAMELSKGYQTFCTVFPYWHQDMYAGELVNNSVVRFVSSESLTGRRINAYRQGIRPRDISEPTSTAIQTTPELRRLFDRSLNGAIKVSQHGVVFPDLRELQEALYELQDQRTSAMARRYQETQIGDYKLSEFRRFYSAINAVAATHEFLCYLWSQAHGLPIDSLLLYAHRSQWADDLSRLAKLPRAQVYAMIQDASFGRVYAADFHLLPFVPLTERGTVLALAPFCSLSSNWEENVLRCLSRRDSDLYSSNNLTKEEEMRRPLVALTSGVRLMSGPHKLTKPTPDIDLLVQDLSANILIICELKWSRKPNGYKERRDRDAEVLKGFSQIEKIRHFIDANPEYLYKRGYTAWELSKFKSIHYCVVARDHIVESPARAIPIYGYDEFVSQLRETADTARFLKFMKDLEWLPREGSDFGVRFERHCVGRVAVESEIYYPALGPSAVYRRA
jgi:hypothetical protein